jgi:hypothetical protein
VGLELGLGVVRLVEVLEDGARLLVDGVLGDQDVRVLQNEVVSRPQVELDHGVSGGNGCFVIHILTFIQ